MTAPATTTVAREFTLPPPLGAAVEQFSGLAVPGAAGVVDASEPIVDQLEYAGLLEGGALRPDLATALRIIAAPTRAMTLAVTVPERQSWQRVLAYGTADIAAGYAAASTATGSTVISTFPTAGHLVETAIRPLYLGSLPLANVPAWNLTLESWTALAGISDVLRKRELEATLRRKADPISGTFQQGDVVEAVVAGMDSPDLRWSGSLAMALSPVRLPTAPAAIEAGMQSLQAAHLIQATDGHWQLTTSGELIPFLFRSLLAAGLVGGTQVRKGSPDEWAMAAVLSSPMGAFLLRWDAVSADSASGTLAPASSDDYLAIVGELEAFTLRAPAAQESAAAPAAPASKPCSSCGAALIPAARFCSECGNPVAVRSFCANCGRQLKQGARFCPGCGSTVGQN